MSRKEKRVQPQEKRGLSNVERLRLRVSAMVSSPKAQACHQASIWRLDSDTDLAWEQVMGELAETDGLEMTENEDGTITLQWDAPTEDEMAGGEMETPPEMVVQRLHEEPAPF